MKPFVKGSAILFFLLVFPSYWGNWGYIELPLFVWFLLISVLLSIVYYSLKRFNYKQQQLESASMQTSLLQQEVKQQKDVIVEQEERLSDILQTLDVGVCLIDNYKNLVAYNETAKIIFGDEQVAYGQMITEKIRYKSVSDLINEVYRSYQRRERTLTLHAQNQKVMQIVAIPILYGHQKIRQVIVLFYDVSRVKSLEKVEIDLIANASHELKTPLTIIKGFVETLKDTHHRDEIDTYLDIIYGECQRLEVLIRDVMLLGQSDRQEMHLNPQEVALQDIYDKVFVMSKERLQQQNVTLNIPPTSIHLTVDEERLLQVLLELVNNAITYTKENGCVTIRQEQDDTQVMIHVSDNGIGILPRDIDRVFERFYRGENAQLKNQQGTGLGLAIVKNLVHAMGGKITLSSRLGKGTRVTLSFKK